MEPSVDGLETDASSEGWTTGYSTAGDDEEFQFFRDDVDALELLRGMEAEHGNDISVAMQPFEMVRRAKREAKAKAMEDPTDQESAAESEKKRGRFEQGLDTLCRKSKRRRRHLKKDEQSEQESIVKKLEAEAVLLFAANRIEEGERICREVMRLAPNSADVYQTLGSMIEQTGRQRKALDYYMIAAHLSPKNTEFWKQLSRSSSELGFHRQAVYCLTHVLKIDKHDIDAHIDRALLYAELGENKRACDAFEKIDTMRPGDFEVVKMLGKLYHRMGHPQKAIEVLEHSILRYEDRMDLTVVNILVDLYLEQGSYSEASGLIERTEGGLWYGQTLPVDLKVKRGICALHMGNADTAYAQFLDLLKEPIDECVDLCLRAGDALVDVKEYQQALNLFERLTATTENGPGLWERIVYCKEQSEGRSAVASWWLLFVDTIDPSHRHYLDAALALIKGLVDLGDLELADERMQALKMDLEQDRITLPDNEKTAAELLLLKESLELRIGKRQESLGEMLPIVFRTLRKMRSEYGLPEMDADFTLSPELRIMMEKMQRTWTREDRMQIDTGRERDVIFTGFRSPRKERRFARRERKQSENDVAPSMDVATLFLVEDFVKAGEHCAIFMKVVDGLIDNERLIDAEYFLTSAIGISCRIGKTADRTVRDAFRLKLVHVLRRCNKEIEALEITKKLCTHWPYSIKIWNTYSHLLRRLESSKWLTKFVTGFRNKYPGSVSVILIMGQFLSLLGRYQMAIGEYKEALKCLPTNPLIWLCLGVAKLGDALGEPLGVDRNFAILQTFTVFRQYERYRDNSQESFYNLGRACHQIGVSFLAVEFYNKALNAIPKDPESDISRVIAYNLMTVYKSVGSIELARELMNTYLSI